MPPKSFFGFAIFVASLSSTGWAGGLSWDEKIFDFGETYQFTEVAHDFEVWNRSDRPITFKSPATSAKDLSIEFGKAVLEPGKSTILHVKFAVQDRNGKAVARVPIDTLENGEGQRYEFILRGYVESIFDDPKPGIDFGLVDAKLAPVEKSIRLSSFESPDFRITGVLETPDFVSARVAADGRELFVKPKRFDRLGYSKGSVKLALDSSVQREASVSILMDIHGDVVPDQNPLLFDVQRPSFLRPVRVQLVSRSGKTFRVGKVLVDDAAHASVEATPCLPKARPDCAAYLVTPRKDHPIGQIAGAITFDLPDTHESLIVNLGGIFVGDNTQIHSLNEPAADSATDKESRSTLVPDIGQTLKQAVSEQTVAAPGGSGPLLKWQVENEAAIYGYAIYRSDRENGPAQRVNKTLVAADNHGDNTVASHQWRDTSAVAGKTYWYFIVTLYNNGDKAKLTEPQKVVAR